MEAELKVKQTADTVRRDPGGNSCASENEPVETTTIGRSD